MQKLSEFKRMTKNIIDFGKNVILENKFQKKMD